MVFFSIERVELHAISAACMQMYCLRNKYCNFSKCHIDGTLDFSVHYTSDPNNFDSITFIPLSNSDVLGACSGSTCTLVGKFVPVKAETTVVTIFHTAAFQTAGYFSHERLQFCTFLSFSTRSMLKFSSTLARQVLFSVSMVQ